MVQCLEKKLSLGREVVVETWFLDSKFCSDGIEFDVLVFLTEELELCDIEYVVDIHGKECWKMKIVKCEKIIVILIYKVSMFKCMYCTNGCLLEEMKK